MPWPAKSARIGVGEDIRQTSHVLLPLQPQHLEVRGCFPAAAVVGVD